MAINPHENIISSRKNNIIKDVKELQESAKKRSEKGLFVLEGARLCYDAVRTKTGIFRLLYTKKAYEKYKNYIDPIKEKAKEIYIIEEHVEGVISKTKTSQGVFLVCEIPQEKAEIKGKILVMENVQDPVNVGTILRSGEALGIETFVFLGQCADAFSPKVTRGSMGAIFRLNILNYDNLDLLISDLSRENYDLYAAVPDDTAIKINTIKFKDKSAVFIGNEGNGLTEECINKVLNVTIPMLGRAESLNASSAATVVMWEMVRNV